MSKEVEVTCCAECDFMSFFGYPNLCHNPYGRQLIFTVHWEWYKNRVHTDCPLKSGSITIKLKEDKQ